MSPESNFAEVFDWMNKKKRMTGFPELGVPGVQLAGSEAYQAMRAIDNRFYWVSSDQIDSKYFYENKNAGKNAVPARFQRPPSWRAPMPSRSSAWGRRAMRQTTAPATSSRRRRG